MRKNKSLIINIPRSLVEPFGGVDWIKEGENAFHMNAKCGKTIISDEGMILSSKKSALKWVSTSSGSVRATYEVTVEALEALLKEAKKKQKQFNSCYFIHPSPDLSFMFVANKKKKKSSK